MTKPMPDTVIFINRNKLTDGSETFDVQLGDHVWHAVTEDDAIEMANKIADAINDHSNDSAGIVGE
jgi:hypothetical protein